MTTIQLTPAQHAILAYAIEHTGGKIEWFPDRKSTRLNSSH